jgi:pilus assembly protein CpaB
LLALGTAALVFFVIQQSTRQAAEREAEIAAQLTPEPTIKLPVAARQIVRGNVLASTDVTLRDFPVALVPTTAITSAVDLENKVLARDVGEGEFFTPALFTDDGTGIAPQIPAGRVLFAFPIVDLLSQSDVVREGDRIDLLLTLTPPPGDQASAVTMLTLQNIEVFRILRNAAPEGDTEQLGDPTSLVCSVTPEDALMLKYIKDSGGVIDFALRSPLNREDEFTSPSVNLEEVLNRYRQQ